MEYKNALKTGTQVKSPSRVYTIVHVIGTGAYGITYLATTQVAIRGELGEINVNVCVTLKEFFMEGCMKRIGDVVERDHSNDEVATFARCFYLEADKLSTLSHPNIVNVLEVFVTNNTCYYSMEYLSGGSLSNLIQKNGGLSETEALRYIRQIGSALSYMHDRRMLHLDIKPANIVFDDNHNVKIIDYGLSQQYENNGESESTDGLGTGSPGYAPLEQSSKEYSLIFAPTLDIYALGATYYKMLTDCTPPDAVTLINSGINTLPLVQNNVSQQSIDAIKAAMQPMADKRPQTVSDFLAMLPAADDQEEIPNDTEKKKKHKAAFIVIAAIVAIFVILWLLTSSAQAQNLMHQYCNPLPMEIGPGANASGDVSVILDGDTYYMFCTGGGAWVSNDLLNWKYRPVQHVARIPVAPDVVKFNGRFYMSGNDCPLYVADDPLGPYELVGEWSNTGEISEGWNGAFDTHIFVDDDNQPYLFWPGRGISGIFGVKLNPDKLNEFAGKPVHLFGFNSEHVWERYGEMNEYPGVAWIEGPWVIKRNGTYYLEYSASGTQWKTYAEGYYTAKSPLGPYHYAKNNPLLRKTEGLVTGTAHGSIVKGLDNDNLWQFYTIVLSNPPGGRRIGMDRVSFDKKGNMSVTLTETPQPAPLYKPADNVNLPVTINKMRAMNALSKASSEQPGFYASYAVDNLSGTVWMPADDDREPSLLIELSPATRFDVVQLFTVSSMRILFGGISQRMSRGFGGGVSSQVYKYKLEVSMDGQNFTTALDRTGNTVARNTTFDEFKPVECRFVKLTVTGWPENAPRGIIDFTVFGYPSGEEPAAVASPVFSNLPPDK